MGRKGEKTLASSSSLGSETLRSLQNDYVPVFSNGVFGRFPVHRSRGNGACIFCQLSHHTRLGWRLTAAASSVAGLPGTVPLL